MGTAFQNKYDPIEGCALAAEFVIWGKAALNLVIKKGKNFKRALKSAIKDIIHSPLKSVGIISSQRALD